MTCSRGSRTCSCAGQAGGHLPFGAEPALSRRRHRGLLAGGIHRGRAARARNRRPELSPERGVDRVKIDFTEGRLAVKLDPSGSLLSSFIEMNNISLDHFSADDRRRIGVHTCPGGDRDSTHSADVDYSALLPSLFELNAGRFYIALARDDDRIRVLKMIRQYLKPGSDSVHRRHRSARSPHRVGRGRQGSRPRSGAVHSDRSAGYDRRLRLRAILRRPIDEPRHGVRQDSRASRRDGACLRGARTGGTIR